MESTPSIAGTAVEPMHDLPDWADVIVAVRAVAAMGFRHNSIGIAAQLRARTGFLLRQFATGAARGDAVPPDGSREERMLALLERAALSGHGAMAAVRWPARLGARIDLAEDLTEIERSELDAETLARIERDTELWEVTISGLSIFGSYGFSV